MCLCHLTGHLFPPLSHPHHHLAPHRLLANKDDEQEESSEQVKAVNDSEEDLERGGVVITGAAMVTMDQVV